MKNLSFKLELPVTGFRAKTPRAPRRQEGRKPEIPRIEFLGVLTLLASWREISLAQIEEAARS